MFVRYVFNLSFTFQGKCIPSSNAWVTPEIIITSCSETFWETPWKTSAIKFNWGYSVTKIVLHQDVFRRNFQIFSTSSVLWKYQHVSLHQNAETHRGLLQVSTMESLATVVNHCCKVLYLDIFGNPGYACYIYTLLHVLLHFCLGEKPTASK